MQMEVLSRGDIFPKVIEAYSRPSRIIRGKDIDADLEVIMYHVIFTYVGPTVTLIYKPICLLINVLIPKA